MLPSRHGHFHIILILPIKIVELLQQHAKTTAHWLSTQPLPTAARNSILNVVEFLDLSLKTSPCTKTSLVSCKNQSCFLLFRNAATFIESHHVFLCYFLQYDEVFFDQPFRRLLPLSCFHASTQWLFKVKINCKTVNVIKK